MSNLANAMRANRQITIGLNPTQITITRTAKTRQGGGFAQTPPTALAPITVRIYHSRASQNTPDASIAGVLRLQPWGMLADHHADLQAGPQITEEFTVTNLGRFRIDQVFTDTQDGQVYGYQARLEKVT